MIYYSCEDFWHSLKHTFQLGSDLGIYSISNISNILAAHDWASLAGGMEAMEKSQKGKLCDLEPPDRLKPVLKVFERFQILFESRSDSYPATPLTSPQYSASPLQPTRLSLTGLLRISAIATTTSHQAFAIFLSNSGLLSPSPYVELITYMFLTVTFLYFCILPQNGSLC